METITFIAILVMIGFLMYTIYKSKKEEPNEGLDSLKGENVQLKFELSQKDQKIGELTKSFETEKTKKDDLSGQNKILYVENEKLKKDVQVRDEKVDNQNKKITIFETEKKQKELEVQKQIDKLDSAEKALVDEKARIRKEDEERQVKESDERDRMWNEHEEEVVRLLSEICKNPEHAFTFYNNKNLPDGFDGKLKPDFMIDFLGQYMIFDPKTSRSNNLQTYLDTQVKDAVKKYKSNSQINKTVFFVVPTVAVSTLKKFHYYEDGYTFFIVSPEALMPIVASLKKITNYEFAENMDPQEKENIINLIAEFDHHINFRNAVDLILTQSGINVLNKASELVPELEEDIKQKKSQKRLNNIKPNDIKRLMYDKDTQQRDIRKIVAPKAQIDEENIEKLSEIVI